MAWIALALGLVFVGLIVLAIASGPSYRKMYAPEHMIELAQKLGLAKASALANVLSEQDADAPPDPTEQVRRGSAFVTSVGLAVVYTVSRSEHNLQHHISLSYRGGPFARASATLLLTYLHGVLEFGDCACNLTQSETGIFHFVALMNEQQHEAFACHPVRIPEPSEIPEIIKACSESDGRTALLDALTGRRG